MSDNTDNRSYKVLVNDEEQYSLWLATKELPLGWHETPKSGSKEECLAYVKEVWVDMRPKSLREFSSDAKSGKAK